MGFLLSSTVSWEGMNVRKLNVALLVSALSGGLTGFAPATTSPSGILTAGDGRRQTTLPATNSSATRPQSVAVPVAKLSSEEVEILACLMASVFQDHPSMKSTTIAVGSRSGPLSYSFEDPPIELLDRLRKGQISLYPYSESKRHGSARIDDPGREFVTFAKITKWVSPTEARAERGYLCGGRCGFGSSAIVKKVDGKWTVAEPCAGEIWVH